MPDIPTTSNMNEALAMQNSAAFRGDYADQVWKLSCGTHKIQTLITNQKELKLQLFIKIPAQFKQLCIIE